MYALFLILNDTYLLDDVHEILYECHVGATTMDSVGLGKVLLEHENNLSAFSRMRKLLEGDKPYNKTIVSVIRDERKLNEVAGKLMKILDGIDKAGVGFMFVLPVLQVYGYKSSGPYSEYDDDIEEIKID